MTFLILHNNSIYNVPILQSFFYDTGVNISKLQKTLLNKCIFNSLLIFFSPCLERKKGFLKLPFGLKLGLASFVKVHGDLNLRNLCIGFSLLEIYFILSETGPNALSFYPYHDYRL